MSTAGVLPLAEVLTVTSTKTTRLVLIRCPICARKHQHGWPYSLDVIGSRVAHCVGRNVPPGSPGSYSIPTPTEQESAR
jgi:hypothetical protein